MAQGTTQPVVMHTGSGSVLLTKTVAYLSGTNNALLDLQFGFATAEQPQPGLFADSFTISVTGPGGTAYLVTVDANGVVWAPVTPGALPVTENAIQRQAVPFLVPTEGLPWSTAFQLDYSLPLSWQGVALTLNFDLFDNQNGQPSLAYFSTAAVPEPSGLSLLALGVVVWRCRYLRLSR